MTRSNPSFIESLENRTLLSITVAPSLVIAPIVGPTPLPIIQQPTPVTPTPSTGILLHLTAGTPFTGEVAFYPSPVLDPPDGFTANIAWGDGTITPGKLQYTVDGGKGGYEIIGSHTYKLAGTDKIKTTVIEGPINGGTGPVAGFPSHIVAVIPATAIVRALPPNSPGGVTVFEKAGATFTAAVGTFETIAPGAKLAAVINWGDGTTSAGVLTPDGVIGLDVLKFAISGTHSYAANGSYAIQITIFKQLVGPQATAIVPIVAAIESTAIVGPLTPVAAA